jgi:hypothetical protein
MRRINSSLLTTLPGPSSKVISTSKGAPAELDRRAVGEEFEAMR